jgi:ABC-type branched-subunit amino acid transport system substrate-binding protein
VVVTADNEGQMGILGYKTEVLDRMGIEYEVIETFAADTDFSGPATQIIALEPEAVIITQTGEAAALTVKALREFGYDGFILGNDTLSNRDLFEVAGDTLVGIPMPVTFSPVDPRDPAQNFLNLYKTEYGKDPDIYAAQGYQAMWMMVMGLKAGGEGTRAAVLQGLLSLSEIPTPGGTFTIDEEGQAHAQEISFIQWNEDLELAPWP